MNNYPNGRPVLLENLNAPLIYDFHDPDSQYTMFSKRLAGHFLMTFNMEMDPMVKGTVTAGCEPVPYILERVLIDGNPVWYLGLKLSKLLYTYDQIVTISIGGFRSRTNSVMETVKAVFRTPSRVLPLPRYASHEATALQAARDGCVLLRNNRNILPLPEGADFDLLGDGIFEFRLSAYGAGKINPRHAVGLMEAAGQYVCRKPGRVSDTAMIVISRASGENLDNTTAPGDYNLSASEESVLAAARKKYTKLIVILNTGFPVNLSFIRRYDVEAVLWCGYGGMWGGQAVMDLLTGKCCPSGHLTDTWAEDYTQYPCSDSFYDSFRQGEDAVTAGDTWFNTVYQEDIYLGYRYFETFRDASPGRYPFGFGLTYTSFSHSVRTFSFLDGTLYLEVRVSDTGNREGRDVVQLYVEKPCGVLNHPARELIAFEKTRLLRPGESEDVCFMIPQDRLACYDEQSASYILDYGLYHVYEGDNVRDASLCGSFKISQAVTLKRVKNRLQSAVPFKKLQSDGRYYEPPKAVSSGVAAGGSAAWAARKNPESFIHSELSGPAGNVSFQDLLKDPGLTDAFVGAMDVKTLARLSVCASHGWGMEGRGEAGRLFRPEGLCLPGFIAADGNSGVNLHDKNIGMPCGAVLCSSFDRALISQVGKVIGEEARELGMHMILAPGMNLHRSPLGGRHPEYFSEDPYLAGSMAGSFCQGLESTGTGGCYKHLIANNAETGRKRNQSILSERAVRELYFRAFQYALEVHESVSVMTAYNAVNGVFTSCDPSLIQGLLFEESGYSGFVMTDWCSYDTAPVPDMCRAGISWITPGSLDDTFTSQIEEAVQNGTLELSQLQENVRRLILGLIRLQQLI